MAEITCKDFRTMLKEQGCGNTSVVIRTKQTSQISLSASYQCVNNNKKDKELWLMLLRSFKDVSDAEDERLLGETYFSLFLLPTLCNQTFIPTDSNYSVSNRFSCCPFRHIHCLDVHFNY